MVAKLFTSLMCALALVSCMSSQPSGVTQAQTTPLCQSPAQAQQVGYIDGANGQPSQVGWFTTCGPDRSQTLAAAYAEAYGRGANEHNARMAQQVEAARVAEAQRVQRLCTDPASAYQSGYNAGYRRERMSAEWADQYCNPRDRAGTKQQYMNGFQAGMYQAPPLPQPQTVLVVGATVGATVGTTQDACRFSSDCGEGNSCRHVSELGHNVCMGHGLRGDYCWFDSDCGSEECRLHTGGAKTCD